MSTSGEQTESDYSPQPAQGGDTRTLSYASIIPETERQELLEKVTYIPEGIDANTVQLTTLNYQVDHAIREACLAEPNRWREESDTLIFTSSNRLKIYLGRPGAPLPTDEARTRICEMGISTVITARIALGLWSTRRLNKLLQTENRSIVMRLEEIFEWRGIKKHSYSSDSGKRYTNGYEVKHKSQALKDLDLLASCCIRGQITYASGGKQAQEIIDSSYLQYGIITRDTNQVKGITAGIFLRPGDWLQVYITHDNFFIAQTDRKVLQLNPQNRQHELKLALFLIETWRQQARGKNFNKPILMAHLLALSMIHVTKASLTVRLAPRIQDALETLQKQGIIGQLQCITPVDASQLRWGNAWLASQWIISPPSEQVNVAISRTRQSSKEPRSTSTIKAIETLYGGRRYRARIEAKWNIFYEALDIDNRYEEEGYTFDGVCYLPDFWLPIHQCWIEIKGEEPSEDELEKACLLSLYKEKPVYIFFGETWLPNQQKHSGAYCCRNGKAEKGYFWYECLNCEAIGLGSSQDNSHFLCQCSIALSPTNRYSNSSNRLLEAYTSARQARFEYGERRNKRAQNKTKAGINEERDEE